MASLLSLLEEPSAISGTYIDDDDRPPDGLASLSHMCIYVYIHIHMYMYIYMFIYV
jgi:hypothetical protein